MYLPTFFPDYPHCKGGNFLISGNYEPSGRRCVEGMYLEFLKEGHPLFVVHDQLSDARRITWFRAALDAGYQVCWFGPGGSSCPDFDVLSAALSVNEKADLACQFLLKKEDTACRETAYRYLWNAITAKTASGEAYTLQDLLNMGVEDVRSGIAGCSLLSPAQQESELRFLETRAVYECWGVLNSRAFSLHAGGLLEALSGLRSAEELFDGKKLILVSKSTDEGDTSGIFPRMLNGMLSTAAALCNRRNAALQPYHILINGTAHIPTATLERLLQVGTAAAHIGCPLCLHQSGIGQLLELHKDSILSHFSAFAVFQTMEGAFWSAFFGTMLTPEVQHNYEKKRFPFIHKAGGGVVTSPYGKPAGTSVQRVEKPLYEPRIFATLKDDTCIFYNLRTGRKGRKHLEGASL